MCLNRQPCLDRFHGDSMLMESGTPCRNIMPAKIKGNSWLNIKQKAI